MDTDEELSKIKIALQNYMSKEMPGYEVHMFDREKQKERELVLQKRLPLHDHACYPIKKSDAWIVWICDENRDIIDLQVYDFQQDSGPYRRQKIVEYVDYSIKKEKPMIPYRDCGCVNSDWDEWKLADVYFKFGFQWRFLNTTIMIKCLKRLALIDEFQENIKRHLKFICDEE